MRRKSAKKTVFLFLVLIIVFIHVTPPAYALKKEGRTVKIAYPIQKGLTDLDEYNDYIGYTYEYLQEIAQYTGWNYEFVKVEGNINTSAKKLMKMVESGEVDLMGAMIYDDDFGKIYNYSSHSYGVADTVLQVLYDDTKDIFIDPQTTQTLKVAVIRNNNKMIKDLEEYCKRNLITLQYVYCDSEKGQIQAMQDGSAEAMLNSSINYIENVKTIAKFSPKPFYFITGKGDNNDLIKELDKAISNIDQTDPYFSTSLHEKYFVQPNYNLSMTKSESEYIKKVDILKVGVLNNQPPFQYKDSENGELKGISVDLLKYISSKTGFHFNMIEAKTQKQLDQMIKSGEVDIVAGMTYSYELAQKQNVSMTQEYISSQYTMMLNGNVNKDTIKGKRLAMIKNSTYRGDFIGNVVRYDTIDECIQAVNNGEADYTYVNEYSAQYYINLPKFNNIKMIPQTYENHKVCFGIIKPINKELLGILNKSISGIPVEDMQAIIYKNTTYKPDFSLSYFINRNPVQTILVISGILLSIIIALALGIYQRVKMNKKTSLELEKHLRVYGLMNDYFIEYDYKKNTLMFSVPPTNENEQPKLITYDYSKVNKSESSTRQRAEFLNVIKSQEDGIKEAYLFFIDEEFHWLRFAIETVYEDTGLPAYTIGKINIIDNEKKEKDILLEKAQRDSLTHIFNAETSMQMVKQSLYKLRVDEKGAIFLLDVDHFKSINDTYGHLRGDKVLKAVADILSENFEREDIVGRPGGDEFIVYMKKIQNIDEIIEKCLQLNEKVQCIYLDENRYITVSIGVAVAFCNQEYDELYQKADKALYCAKEKGRNRFEIANFE